MNPPEKYVIGKVEDYIFICFPLWIPLVLYFSISSYPENIASIFLLALLIFGETHFAATWLFFLDRNNWEWIWSKPVIFIVFPMGLLIFVLSVAWFKSVSAALMVGAVFSAIHVTRQSIGITKMFSQKKQETLALAYISIYTMSIIFVLIGFARFYMDAQVFSSNIESFRWGAWVLALFFFFYLYFKTKDSGESWKFYITTFTGIFLYSPYAVSDLERPEIATIMGVGMHWVQYLALTIPLYLRKGRQTESGLVDHKHHGLFRSPFRICSFLFIYSLLMVMFRQGEKGFFTFDYSSLILIPLSFQVLHYYYDAFIWQFSNPHIRNQVGRFILLPQEPLESRKEPV
jgi:hypothetical protein